MEKSENFESNGGGRLLWSQMDPDTRFKYTIWFDYTRKLVNELHEGDLVAVPNFSTNSKGVVYSILQLINVMPMHYALGTNIGDLKGHPGFIMQAAKSASSDWTEQESESYEDTTKIICEAIPTNLEYDEDSGNIQTETAMAMIGKDVKRLNTILTEQIFNGSLTMDSENVIEAGKLIRDPNVGIYLRTEDMIRTHFGIFGFTGVGKSNLMSTLVDKLLSREEPVKIIMFDLMDEYIGPLMDKILENNGKIICLGEKTLMGPVFEYINNPENNDLEKASDMFLKNIFLPKGLKDDKQKFKNLVKSLLKQEKIKIYDQYSQQTVGDFLESSWPNVKGSLKEPKLGILEKVKKDVFGKHLSEELTPELALKFIDALGYGSSESALMGYTEEVRKIKADDLMKNNVNYGLIEPLKEVISSSKIKLNDNAKIDIWTLINEINDEKKPALYLITSHDEHKIKYFAKELGSKLFWKRRSGGMTSPSTLFIFDEADRFISQKAVSESEKASKAVVEELTRRGRKFGIGVGLATQRSAYLDTNIIGQLHTYFISKLPRQYDRNVIGEAFSLSPEQFTQTFKFKKGQWLLVSHEATGIDLPIPIQAENAEERVKKYINEFKSK
ncbi:hypothetical protein HNP87_001452 [Methanococcus maripaludis]|uniref:Helicase HerA central domain-containing protein n=1 Tax=Methanococcus maripaludis TaxID=39152 RepID=A0A7J9NK22_METMI|nr:ATP-binding protein [Methanococcus maripaludis]MBA2840920.1 hypothetical protein [Methanococcus maripaludis]